MFCKNCGSQINDSADFCPNCGSKNESKSAMSHSNINAKRKSGIKIPVVPILICVFVVIAVFGVKAFLNRSCSMCDNNVFKKGLCRDHYSQYLIEENINDIKSGNKSVEDAIKDTYDKGLTNAEKNRIKKSADNIRGNIDDVKSGNKDIFEAAQDIYDKNLTKKEKQQVEDKVNEIKNSLGDLFK